jgi:hypothetical protein
MAAASSSVKLSEDQLNSDWFLLSLIIFSSFAVIFGGDANKLGAAAAVVVGGDAFGSR